VDLKFFMRKFLLILILVILNSKSVSISENCIDYNPYDVLHKKLLKESNFMHKDNFKKIDPLIFRLMVDECDKYNLPHNIFFALVDKESGFKFISNSEGSGATGYMQLMPKTFWSRARKLGLKKHTPENNIKVGAYHLSELQSKWNRKFKDNELVWNWTIAEYMVGQGGLRNQDTLGIRYQIPQHIKPTIKKIMRNY